MKILLVNDYATPTGGAEILTLALREGLRSRGHDARLFASSARPLNAYSQADYSCFGTTSRFRTLLQTANPFAFYKFHQVLNEFQPDVIHVTLFLTQLSPLILPLLKNFPSLYYAVWYRSVCPLGTKMLPNSTACQIQVGTACYRYNCLPLRDWLPLMVQMRLWKSQQNAFKLIVAASEAVKQQLKIDGIESGAVVWHGVPLQIPRSPLSFPPTIAFAARLVKEKGGEILLKAFAKVVNYIPEARLLLVGDGPERDRLKQMIDDLMLTANVTMPGQMDRLEMETLFSKAWVQVVPSLWAEPFGLIAANAMMRGTAVVASASGGLTEIVQHAKTGFLVPPGHVDALADALLKLLQDRELAEQMGQAGKEVAIAQFSEDVFVDKLINLYQLLVENH
ncbi:glycosyltransferase family 1 protein [Aphanothece hegewaldii CCALA 016]|uniref:Glycosyltransferase family 1 protein n=1 Tax=Aphanothece hegewaldii CCALA 016 TaxID=2107694 RepID=A0A2T1M2Z8_9CHRO|nr:glycosyltransferase family 4 protein [Aphanothece hegewaldii]PSF39213.1 glycosyltransferase family 1 protein [Aphanothece hegewaldii CCALA 016]